MRFYSTIRIQPEKHLNEICENPYLVFCTDFMYYLSKLHNVDWNPIKTNPDRCLYQPHPFSPCTKNVKEVMHLVHAKSGLSYELLYEELVPATSENKLELFICRINKIHRQLTDNPLGAFFLLLHVGRWTIRFYKHGTKDAAHLAPYLMADALKKTIGDSSIVVWFRKLDVIAKDIAELLKSDIVEGFAEEYSHYFEELDLEDDDKDFNECSFCVCGHCEDRFGQDEVYEEETDYDLDDDYYNYSDDYYDYLDDYIDYDYYDCYGNSDTDSGDYLEIIENEGEGDQDCD